MRSAGYQDSSAKCWCCHNSRPFYSCLVVLTSFVLVCLLVSLGYGSYHVYTRRDAWIEYYNQSQNGIVFIEEDGHEPQYDDIPDGPNDATPSPVPRNDEPKRTGTRWPTISDEEIKGISSQLWALDRQNQIPPNSYEINTQSRVNISDKIDHATQPLFRRMEANLATWSITLRRFIDLLDNYNPQVKISEETNDEEMQEIEAFLDALLETRVMQALYQFLVEKRYLTSNQQEFRSKLKDLWFGPYSRSSKYNATDSSGFEHVFVGETRGKITGFHSWIQYYLQEKTGNANYYGYHYFLPDQPWLINIQFSWLGKFKKETSFFLGTNPEFDMAIYTLCIMTRTNSACELNINGLNPKVISYDVSHMSGLQLGTAFPAI